MSSFGPALVAFALIACSGASPGSMPPVGEPLTTGSLRGPLCRSQVCECKSKPTSAGLPKPPYKRFEVVAGPADNQLWITIGDTTLYKSNERATDCFYIDLAPGTHHVTLRAQGEAAVGANLEISEQGAGGPWWYETFRFSCGSNVCDGPQLERWKQETAALGTKHDPCGSTKVTGVRYQTGRKPDGIHPVDLLVEADLEVYKFIPDKPSCAP